MTLTGSDISALYELHAEHVLRFLMRRTFDAQVSIDLVGETFAVAFEQRAKFRGSTDAEAKSWVFGISANLLNDFFRSGMTEQRAMSRLGVERVEVDQPEIERIEQLAETLAMRTAVAEALSELSAEHREAVRLRVVDELPYPDVAAQMDVSEQVARARVSRGLKKLREKLECRTNAEVMESV